LASNDDKTRDLAVLQLLTRLIRETDRIVRLADDIDNYAETKQAKDAFTLIGDEVENVLRSMEKSITPLYRLYEIDPGLKTVLDQTRAIKKPIPSHKIITAEIISRQE
jgi:hypothetical protein